MRQVILGILALAIIAGGIMGARNMISSRKPFQQKPRKIVTSVYTEQVANQSTILHIRTSGQLMAKNRLTMFAEVQGVFESTGKEFKPGVYYKKGEPLIKINSDEYYASLQSQKSALYNQIVGIMPDLRLDYPESFPQWDEYVRHFDLNAPLEPLPDPVNEREKLFVSGRNLYTTFYNVESLQRRLEKYNIQAPYSGVITEALVQPGTLVRPGQQLGEFIDYGVYELEAPVNVEYMDLLRVGKSVTLHNIQHTQTYAGKVVRLNGKVEQGTQTITVFIEVSGKGLKEGMYLEAELEAKEEPNTFELNRKLLLDGDQVFVVNDTVLMAVEVEPVYYKDKTVVVRGLDEGTQILAQILPGAYPGMPVRVVNTDQADQQNAE